MEYILIVIGALLINAAIGIAVSIYVANNDEDALHWFLYQVDTKGDMFSMVIHSAWPFILYKYWKNKR